MIFFLDFCPAAHWVLGLPLVHPTSFDAHLSGGPWVGMVQEMQEMSPELSPGHPSLAGHLGLDA